MPQAILPLFSADMTPLNGRIAVQKIDDSILWYQGSIPIFRHHVNDEELFRSFCCQLINLGNATSAEIARALNVNHEKISRWARLERAPEEFEISSKSIKKAKKSKKKTLY